MKRTLEERFLVYLLICKSGNLIYLKATVTTRHREISQCSCSEADCYITINQFRRMAIVRSHDARLKRHQIFVSTNYNSKRSIVRSHDDHLKAPSYISGDQFVTLIIVRSHNDHLKAPSYIFGDQFITSIIVRSHDALFIRFACAKVYPL